MTANTKRISFRKIETPPALRAQRVMATYEVLIDGKAEGHVDKYVYSEMTNPGSHHGQGQRSRMVTGWGWRRPGVREDAAGYERRSEAADWLVKSLGSDS